MYKTNLGLLRIIALMEGVSYLFLLFIAMPVRFFFENKALIFPTGLAHGLLFTLYVAFVLLVGYQLKWSLMKIFWALLASIIPFGTFIADKRLFQTA